ncbi:hypothetical protein HanIR_Chr17g0882341 [Helianthus annuus]|nr:hypothetical protein HanIR_Chr17g0882341 [Helianthus annuus]
MDLLAVPTVVDTEGVVAVMEAVVAEVDLTAETMVEAVVMVAPTVVVEDTDVIYKMEDTEE